MRQWLLCAVALAAAVGLSGCGGSDEPRGELKRVLAARSDAKADYNQAARWVRDQHLKNRKHRDYVAWAMEFASLCLMGGNYDAARVELIECYHDIAVGKGGETAATLSREDRKRFKGEPFERAMVCSYLGLLHYMENDIDNARIFFDQALLADQTTAENMAAFREDFGLAHYFLARCFLHQAKDDNARIGLQKATDRPARAGEAKELAALQKAHAAARKKRDRLEANTYKKASTGKKPIAGVEDMSRSPTIGEMPDTLGEPRAAAVQLAAASADEFFTPKFQGQANLILVIEGGRAPIKTLFGENKEKDKIVRADYPERRMLVYVNGRKAGPAFPLVDLFGQADTRGTTAKDTAQAAKSAVKNVMAAVTPDVMTSMWDVRADDRYWKLLPGEVHVFAAKVAPGPIDVTIQCFDSNGCLLPRYRQTRYALPVRAGQDTLYLLHVQPEADNAYEQKK